MLLQFLIYNLIFFCSFMVILSNQTVNSLIFLTLTFCNISSLIISMGGEFFALLIAIVYLGAVIILFIFTIMLLNIRIESNRKTDWIAQKFTALSFLLTIILFLNYYIWIENTLLLNNLFFYLSIYIWKIYELSNLKIIGMCLYSFPFNINFLSTALILGLGMIGAILLTLYKKTRINRKQDFTYQFTRKEILCIKFKTI